MMASRSNCKLNTDISDERITGIMDMFRNACSDYDNAVERNDFAGQQLAIRHKKKAQTEMLTCMNGFIWWIIKAVYAPFRSYEEDMYQEGAYAICAHMDKYDPKLGRITTYFKPYVTAQINSFIAGYIYGVSERNGKYIVKAKRAISDMQKEEKPWTRIEFLRRTNFSVTTAKNVLAIIRSRETISIEGELFDIPDSRTNPEERLLLKEEYEKRLPALNHLTAVEKDIFLLRSGIYSDALSYEEISMKLGIDLEKVRKKYFYAKQKTAKYYNKAAV